MTRWRKPTRPSRLLSLDETLAALGRDGRVGRRTTEVAVTDIIGSADRTTDFDEQFRLTNPALQPRWQRLHDAMRAGTEPPPVQLVQLGELYFVIDGHHRVSVARSLGRGWLSAHVLQLCTVAYAACCLRAAHLPAKAAERRFLEHVPLPEDTRRQLWLDDPASWSRLTDAVHAWGLRAAHHRQQLLDRCELATNWWHEEVQPVIRQLRAHGTGVDLPDLQLYVAALAYRDQRGETDWHPETFTQLAASLQCDHAARQPLRRGRRRRGAPDRRQPTDRPAT